MDDGLGWAERRGKGPIACYETRIGAGEDGDGKEGGYDMCGGGQRGGRDCEAIVWCRIVSYELDGWRIC